MPPTLPPPVPRPPRGHTGRKPRHADGEACPPRAGIVLPSIAPRAAGIRARLRHLRRNERGTTAVEFALIAVPFFMMLTAVFEAGLVTIAQQTLDSGVDRASRQIFSGQFQTAADGTPGAARFQKIVCGMLIYADCSSVRIEVTTASTFAKSSPTNPYQSKTQTADPDFGKKFQCPAGNDIVTVRAIAFVPRLTRFLALNGIQMADGTQMVMSTAVFRAEPFPSGSC